MSTAEKAPRTLYFLREYKDRSARRAFVIDHRTDCWIWQGCVWDGYATVHDPTEGKSKRAHRYYYEQSFGAVPAATELHHMCFNKVCVNPRHLLPMTRKDHRRMHEFNRRMKQIRTILGGEGATPFLHAA